MPKKLIIYSSGTHYGPLIPPANLRYDLRTVTNPPRHIRGNLDGRSKKLREHLLGEKDFVEILDVIYNEIHKVLSEQREGQSFSNIPNEEEEGNDNSGLMIETQTLVDSAIESSSLNRHSNEDDMADSETLRVNCFCFLGRHRSASIVEELARMPWPDDVDLEVVHRDIDKDRRKPKENRKKGRDKKNLHFKEVDNTYRYDERIESDEQTFAD